HEGKALEKQRDHRSTGCRKTHIPADYVVTPRCSHNSLDLAIRYPHDVSSASMAISTEGEIWNNLPKRHAKTAPLPSISRTHPPTSDCSAMAKRSSSLSSPSSSRLAFNSPIRQAATAAAV